MLNRIQLEEVRTIGRLTLDAPKLKDVKYLNCSGFLRLDLVHVESVERLIIDKPNQIQVKNWKSLKYAYIKYQLDSMFLSILPQLEEIHIFSEHNISTLFEQKQRYGRVNLAIFYHGGLLDGPNDPVIRFLTRSRGMLGKTLEKCTPFLADQIPFHASLSDETVECIPRGSEAFLKRITDLHQIVVSNRIEDIDHFLNILKNSDSIVNLFFSHKQRQVLFNRLPYCCALQKLVIRFRPTNFRFLYRLKHLIELGLCFSIDAKIIRKVFEELKFLLGLKFKWINNDWATIEVKDNPKRFRVSVKDQRTEVSDLDSAIRFIFEEATN